MKHLKKVLSIVLCLAILSAFAPTVFADNNVITELSANYEIPAAGEKFDFSKISVPDGAHYSAVISSVYYDNTEAENFVYINADDTIMDGVRYWVRVRFTAESGYNISNDAQYTINGKVCSTFVGKNMIETAFYGEEKTPEDPEPTPVRVGILQRIKGFFGKIFNAVKKILFFWK